MRRSTKLSSSPFGIPHAGPNIPMLDFWPPTRKKLPGHYGQQELSADAQVPGANI
jgi:hypothetical protein